MRIHSVQSTSWKIVTTFVLWKLPCKKSNRNVLFSKTVSYLGAPSGPVVCRIKGPPESPWQESLPASPQHTRPCGKGEKQSLITSIFYWSTRCQFFIDPRFTPYLWDSLHIGVCARGPGLYSFWMVPSRDGECFARLSPPLVYPKINNVLHCYRIYVLHCTRTLQFFLHWSGHWYFLIFNSLGSPSYITWFKCTMETCFLWNTFVLK